MDREPIALFSYGTLQQREVQLATYGRELAGEPDVLVGYRPVPLVIDDPRVVAVSGNAVHTIARATADPSDRITGMRFDLTQAELAATDAYETSAYARVEVRLESGKTAWAYADGRS